MLLRLHNYEVHRLKESLEEERETAVARKGPVGNAAVDYNDGYAPERGLPYKVGPYLRLYQDQYGKVRTPHEAPDGKRYVERQGEYVRRRAELTPEQVSRIVRVRGYYDGVIRFCPQEPDQVLRYDRLSHRSRVYPYGPLKRVARGLRENALGQIVPGLALQCEERHEERQSGKDEQVIYQPAHTILSAASVRATIDRSRLRRSRSRASPLALRGT